MGACSARATPWSSRVRRRGGDRPDCGGRHHTRCAGTCANHARRQRSLGIPKWHHMPMLAIVYFSISGTTEKLAHALARGAAAKMEIAVCRISGDDIVSGRFQNESLLETVDRAGAVAFGSPTYMGGP